MSRIDRINELLRAELAQMISAKLPLDQGLITVIRVKCGADLKYATVFISVLPENISGTVLKNLRRHSSEFSRELKSKLKMKFIPNFSWKIDSAERYAANIEKVFDELN